jgi:hypothetical protein
MILVPLVQTIAMSGKVMHCATRSLLQPKLMSVTKKILRKATRERRMR